MDVNICKILTVYKISKQNGPIKFPADVSRIYNMLQTNYTIYLADVTVKNKDWLILLDDQASAVHLKSKSSWGGGIVWIFWYFSK
jgi:hypothetical protein